jgi:hypothetical protein
MRPDKAKVYQNPSFQTLLQETRAMRAEVTNIETLLKQRAA